MNNDVDRREFNFEFDPDKVYVPTHSLRNDNRPGGYGRVVCPPCDERDGVVVVTTERIQEEVERSRQNE